jgi:crotonobetainyl-CoA:carnitine CoA-transferase CaiB-like acyl-CoA transferase
LLDDALRVIEPPAMGSGVEASNAREAAGSIACTGQIAIGGPQLAQGYLNQSALTAERFVEHPTLGTLNILNQAIKLSRTPGAVVTATPERGEHSDEILREIGLSATEVAELRESGVIR